MFHGCDCKSLFLITLLYNIVYFLFVTHAVTIEGSVRLAGVTAANAGRVEVYHNDEWGTVCDDMWDITDANVVCRQLNYSGATAAPKAAFFGAGSGPIHYDNVGCTGNETRLADCSHNGIGIHDCGHNEDVGVVCRTNAQGECRACSNL